MTDVYSIQIRPLQQSDIPFAMKLTSSAGWNQLESDWEFLISATGGHFLALYDGNPAGTTTTLTYQNNYSWIGMVLVDPAFRGKGIGTALLKKSIDFTRQTDLPAAGLDATPQGQKLYNTLGFVTARKLIRFELTGQSFLNPDFEVCESITEMKMNKIIMADTLNFGSNREGVLSYLFENYPQYAFSIERGANISGYCFGRSGRKFEHIGPVIAENSEDAKTLLLTALFACNGKSVIVDAFTDEPWMQILKSIGFSEQRPFFRMYRGQPANTGITATQFAAAGPELG